MALLERDLEPTGSLAAVAQQFLDAWTASDRPATAAHLARGWRWQRNGSLLTGAPPDPPPAVTAALLDVDEHSASALLVRTSRGDRREPIGFINLQFDGCEIARVSEGWTARRPPRPAASPVMRLLTFLGVVAYILVDELFFSWPILMVAALWRPWTTFVLLTPLYFALGVVMGVVVARIRAHSGTRSRLRDWLDAKLARRGLDWESRVVRVFGLAGFGLVAIALGPLLAPWLAYRRGYERQFGVLIVVGSLFWSLCLVATYSGLAAIVF